MMLLINVVVGMWSLVFSGDWDGLEKLLGFCYVIFCCLFLVGFFGVYFKVLDKFFELMIFLSIEFGIKSILDNWF